MAKIDNKYDAIIIGAGIGGLVSGCYLAKKGLKTLIIEKNNKVGGYCTSFKRGDYTFDVGIRSLSECGEKSRITKILKDLQLEKEMEIIRTKTNEIVITPDYKINFGIERESVIEELTKHFKREAKDIVNFIDYLLNTPFVDLFTELKDKTFDYLLKKYFTDGKLKSILKIFLGSLGLPSHKASALVGAILYRDQLLNGGYYIKGGMQTFSDKFAKKFKEFGGVVLLSNEVEKIILKDNIAHGVRLKTGAFIESNYVISNADATHTFLNMLGENELNTAFREKLRKLIPSSSAFVTYIGLKKKINDFFDNFSGIWYFSNYNIDNIYNRLSEGTVDEDAEYIYLASPSIRDNDMAPKIGESIFLILWAPYVNKEYWNENREKITENIIKRTEEIIPNLSRNIVVKETASPITLEKYTLNYKGSVRGWAPLPSQSIRKSISEKTPIENLYLVGHWSIRYAPGGVAMAMTSGHNAAKSILS